MILARKGFVHFLAGLLFISLLGGVWSLGFSQNLAQPEKLEKLLAESKIYDNVIASILDESQRSDEQNGGASSVSLSDTAIKEEAEKAFSPALLESSVNKFIEGNYAWLTGQTPKPDFSIDLTSAKQDFAKKVGSNVTTRLASLAVCTPEQQAQLQIPVDPLTANCRPAALDPKTEGDRVSQEILNSDFLSQPVVTADTLGKDDSNPGKQPYYAQFAQAPKLFRIVQKLPLIFGVLALICTLGIIAVAPERRRGLRRIGVVLALSGIVLIITKIIGDWIVGKFDDQSSGIVNNASLQKPVSNLLDQVESQVTAYSLWFGLAFILLAVGIFVYLYKTREGRPQTSRITEIQKPKDPGNDSDNQPPTARPTPPPPTPSLGLKPPKPKRPRLIQ